MPPNRLDALLRGALIPACDSVLDVGCGNQGLLVGRVPGIARTVGVDVEVPGPEDEVARHSEYERMDIREIGDRFEPRSFEGVVALDVIEHLSREEGFVLLDAMEAIASRRVMVFTPNGFQPQPPTADNPHQEHVSGWFPGDFEARGYQVAGVNGFKPLRGAYAEIRWRPHRLWKRLSEVSESMTESRPRFAYQLLAVKVLA